MSELEHSTQKRRPAFYKSCSNEELVIACYREGDSRAMDELIIRYMPLVHGISWRYCHDQNQLDDLVQVGCIGLINAIKRFDIDKGNVLSTYITPYIKGEIKRYFRDTKWMISVPRGKAELHERIEFVIDYLTGSNKRPPTIHELAKETYATTEEVQEAIIAGKSYRPASLYAPLDGNEEITFLDILGDKDINYSHVENSMLLESMVASASLTEREARIIRLRFYDGLSQTKIANILGISQMQVSRLIRKTLKKLKNTNREEISSGEAETFSLNQPIKEGVGKSVGRE